MYVHKKLIRFVLGPFLLVHGSLPFVWVAGPDNWCQILREYCCQGAVQRVECLCGMSLSVMGVSLSWDLRRRHLSRRTCYCSLVLVLCYMSFRVFVLVLGLVLFCCYPRVQACLFPSLSSPIWHRHNSNLLAKLRNKSV